MDDDEHVGLGFALIGGFFLALIGGIALSVGETTVGVITLPAGIAAMLWAVVKIAETTNRGT